MTEPQTTDPTPDWTSLAVELRCPLCEYNLRGLDNPRCPECGFTFSWAELLQGQQETHRYLFEHHPRRNIWSFWKTYWNDCRPRSFWRELNPAQPVRLGRLLSYWILASCPTFIIFLVPIAIAAVQVFSTTSRYYSPFRAFVTPTQVPGVFSGTRSISETLGEILSLAADRENGASMASVLTAIFWPWLTLLCLLIFIGSMRGAKIRKRHILRAVIYGTDYGILMFVPLAWGADLHRSSGWPALIALLCGMVTLYRVYFAYKLYLRFHLPFATVLSSQIILVLLFIILFLQTYNPY